MTAGAGRPNLIRFGPFEFDRSTGDLRRLGRPVRIQDKPLVVLAALLERAGEVVTRDALRARLWSEDTFVDFDNGLNNAVSRVRAALGDSAASPRYVETLGRRGYRFIAPTETAHAPTDGVMSNGTACVRAWLVGEAGRMPLIEGENVLGREGRDVVELPSSTVSRRHARITIAEEAVIEDLGSKNGTFVGERQIAGPVRLEDGDRVRVGSLLLTFRFARAAGETRTRTVSG